MWFWMDRITCLIDQEAPSMDQATWLVARSCNNGWGYVFQAVRLGFTVKACAHMNGPPAVNRDLGMTRAENQTSSSNSMRAARRSKSCDETLRMTWCTAYWHHWAYRTWCHCSLCNIVFAMLLRRRDLRLFSSSYCRCVRWPNEGCLQKTEIWSWTKIISVLSLRCSG